MGATAKTARQVRCSVRGVQAALAYRGTCNISRAQANRSSHPPPNTMNASTAQPTRGMLLGAETVASKADSSVM